MIGPYPDCCYGPAMSPPIRQATALIHSGFAGQGRGDLAAAERDYRAALDLVPEHPTALQLLGLLAGRHGDSATAEDLMRRSLRGMPAQPHVWNNLGNLLVDTQRSAEALSCFERALALDQRYVDAHYNRARVLLALGKLKSAAEAAQRAAELGPQATPGLLQLQAQIESEDGRLSSAMVFIDRALALAPDKPALLHNKALLLQRSHRFDEALQVHDRALALGLDAADAHYNRGNSLQSLGRHDEALESYRRALQIEPLHSLALYDTARLRWRMGDADFDSELLYAGRQHPSSAVAPGIRAQLLWRAERFQEASEAYAEASQRSPETAGLLDGLARCLVRLGDVDKGLAIHARAVELAPSDVGIRSSHANSLLIARRAQAAEIEAAAACASAPDDQFAWALRGLAWQALADPRATWLNGGQRFISAIDLEPPEGYADMTVFNRALASELLALHSDRKAPLDQTLRHGTQTLGDIFEQRHALVDALKHRIAQAVERYIAALPDDVGHPFLGRRTESWRFADSWSSRLRDCGFHTNHVHPHGWISSAYYVDVPDCCADVQRREGWLHFGLPDFDAGVGGEPALRVQPQPGRLILFPSMMWHGTAPFTSPSQRLSIAFDVLPTGQR